MVSAKVAKTLQSLTPGAQVQLFELDITRIPGHTYDDLFRFCGLVNELDADVIYDGKVYARMPITVDGFEAKTDGTLPAPKMQISNIGGLFAGEIRSLDQLIGCKLRVIVIPARYLDAVNFAAGNDLADPTATASVSEWWVEQKTAETPEYVEFELSSQLDMGEMQVPAWQISALVCCWPEYRKDGCTYAGTKYFNANDEPVTDAADDDCSRSITGCTLRHSTAVSWVETYNDVSGLAAALLANSVLANKSMTPAAGLNAWPAGWVHLIDYGLRITQVRRDLWENVLPFVDVTASGRSGDTNPFIVIGDPLPFASAHPGAFVALLQMASGALAGSDGSIAIGFRLFDADKTHSVERVVTAVAQGSMGSFLLYQASTAGFEQFSYDYSEDNLTHTVTVDTAWLQPVIYTKSFYGDESSFTVRIGMPSLGTRTNWTGFIGATRTVAGSKIADLPMCAFPGCELIGDQ